MYDNCRRTCMQKSAKIMNEIYRKKKNEFLMILDSLFDITHSDTITIMDIDVDKEFIISQCLIVYVFLMNENRAMIYSFSLIDTTFMR